MPAGGNVNLKPEATYSYGMPNNSREFKPIFTHWSRILCSEGGLTLPALAKCFLVKESTLRRWMREHPELKTAIREGKYEYDTKKVEGALLKRAKGYAYTEVTKEVAKTIDPQDGTPVITDPKLRVTKTVRKHVPPDTSAAKHWLSNRDPEKWTEKLEVDVKAAGLEAAIREAHARVAAARVASDKEIKEFEEREDERSESDQVADTAPKSPEPDNAGNVDRDEAGA